MWVSDQCLGKSRRPAPPLLQRVVSKVLPITIPIPYTHKPAGASYTHTHTHTPLVTTSKLLDRLYLPPVLFLLASINSEINK